MGGGPLSTGTGHTVRGRCGASAEVCLPARWGLARTGIHDSRAVTSLLWMSPLLPSPATDLLTSLLGPLPGGLASWTSAHADPYPGPLLTSLAEPLFHRPAMGVREGCHHVNISKKLHLERSLEAGGESSRPTLPVNPGPNRKTCTLHLLLF